jgi:hypothetical protein
MRQYVVSEPNNDVLLYKTNHHVAFFAMAKSRKFNHPVPHANK